MRKARPVRTARRITRRRSSWCRGRRTKTVYVKTDIDRLAVAVAEEAPFKLTLVQPKAPMVQNGSGALKVVAERKPGFTGPITVSMLYNPPGMGSDATVTIPEKQNEAQLPISANGEAKAKSLAGGGDRLRGRGEGGDVGFVGFHFAGSGEAIRDRAFAAGGCEPGPAGDGDVANWSRIRRSRERRTCSCSGCRTR